MNKMLIAIVTALVLTAAPALAAKQKTDVQGPNCKNFTEFVAAVQAQEKAEIKFDVLSKEQLKALTEAMGDIPFEGYDKVVLMHNEVAGMILFLKGECVIGRSVGIDLDQLRAIIGQEVRS